MKTQISVKITCDSAQFTEIRAVKGPEEKRTQAFNYIFSR